MYSFPSIFILQLPTPTNNPFSLFHVSKIHVNASVHCSLLVLNELVPIIGGINNNNPHYGWCRTTGRISGWHLVVSLNWRPPLPPFFFSFIICSPNIMITCQWSFSGSILCTMLSGVKRSIPFCNAAL